MKKLLIVLLTCVLMIVSLTACSEIKKEESTPQTNIKISEDGYWVINGVKTEHKAVGTDGKDGKDGISPTIEVSFDGYIVINGIKTEYKVLVEDKEDNTDNNEEKSEEDIDYLTTNLSEYVYVSESLYKNYNVEIKIPEVTDKDVEEEIIKLLCSRKIVPEHLIDDASGIIVSVGDRVNLFYRGYTIENGVKTYFDSECNFADTTYTTLEIGSGAFIPGFESGLIGKNQNDYATLSKFESGTVESGDIIAITYSVFRADGTAKRNQSAIIDLSDPTLDEIWGDGFTEYFIGKKINTSGGAYLIPNATDSRLKVPTVLTSNGVEGVDEYYDIKINQACRISGGERLVVETRMPWDYWIPELAGKTAYFEVYITSVKDYGVYEFNDEFITYVLRCQPDDLEKYEGENLVEKYKAYIREKLNTERDTVVRAIVEDAFWKQVMEGADFKKLPQSEVDKYYDKSLSEITELFDSYGKYYYDDLNAFARDCYGIGSTDDWMAMLRQDAECAVKQKLIFYYIVRKEDWNPTGAEYNELYEEIFADHLQEYLDYYRITEDLADYEEKVAEGIEVVKATYGEEYFQELVLYEYVMEKIISYAVIV